MDLFWEMTFKYVRDCLIDSSINEGLPNKHLFFGGCNPFKIDKINMVKHKERTIFLDFLTACYNGIG